MDGARFDSVSRVLSSGAPRRSVLAGLLATLPVALGGDYASAKKKCKGKKKKCGKKCIPKANCCTDNDCEAGETCTDGACVKPCSSCQNGSCATGQCLCPFGASCIDGEPGTCTPCSSDVCCTSPQTCLNGSCGVCPESPEPCLTAQTHVCGNTDAEFPFCFCVTSVDDVTTCTSVFGLVGEEPDEQSTNCEHDDDCAGLLGPGMEMVCVNVPCINNALDLEKLCLNKGCVDLSAGFTGSRSDRSGPRPQQFDLRSRR